MDTRKKRVLFASNYCGAKTGFGGFMREILSYLYRTGKYELGLYAAGMSWENPDFERWPWKTYGTLPMEPAVIEQMRKNPDSAKAVNYGEMLADRVVDEFKPDVFISCEDPWGVDVFRRRGWWAKFPCVVHTTLDSRPIYPIAVDLAKSTPYFFSWAQFATDELIKMGVSNAKTMRGSVNTDVFRKLEEDKRKALRQKHNIPPDAFCFGMLSRNQLRKSFPNIIKAYVLFKKAHPELVTRLMFFTHFSEGWDIPSLCKEMGVEMSEVLATYKCRQTSRYYVRPFTGQDLDNPETGDSKSLVTTNVQDGLTEEQVNEWYNLLDVYVHAFTSGGQERSIQEAKLVELITLVTNYSCGEDSCQEGAASFPLEYDEYREPGTQFIKATTRPQSIVEQLERFLTMDVKERGEWGARGRQWVLDNFSIEIIGRQMEELIDSLPLEERKPEEKEAARPDAEVEQIEDHLTWITQLYARILSRKVDEQDGGVRYWMQELGRGAPRDKIEEYFRNVAREDLEKAKGNPVGGMGDEPPQERILICMPESLGDILYLSCLLESARKLYPAKVIYVATNPQYYHALAHLKGKYFDRWLSWRAEFDNSFALEGRSGGGKMFEVVINPHILTQRYPNLSHCINDRHALELGCQSTTRNAIIK